MVVRRALGVVVALLMRVRSVGSMPACETSAASQLRSDEVARAASALQCPAARGVVPMPCPNATTRMLVHLHVLVRRGLNRAQVKKYLEKQGSLGYEDKDTGRDRRARDQLNLLRHSLQWGLGTIRTSDGLAAASSIETDKLRFVAGSEDFMYRVTIEYQDKDNKGSQSSSSSADDDAEDVEMADADGDYKSSSSSEVSSKISAASSKG